MPSASGLIAIASALAVGALGFAHGPRPVLGQVTYPSSPQVVDTNGTIQVDGPLTIHAIDFVSARTGWVLATNQAGHMLLYGTSDGGQQWTLRHDGWQTLGDASLTVWPMQVAFANSEDGLMVLGESSSHGTPLDPSSMYAEVARTTDGGRQWHVEARNLVLGDGPLSLAMTGPSSAWLSSGNAMAPETTVWHTVDGGTRWSHRTVPSRVRAYMPGAGVLQTTRPNDAVLLTGLNQPHGKVTILDQITTDGGQHWRTAILPTTGLPLSVEFPATRNPSAAYLSITHQWLIAGSPNGPQHLYAYQPVARRWQRVTTPAPPVLISMEAGGVGYVSNDRHLWRTMNNGKSWVLLPSPAQSAVSASPSHGTAPSTTMPTSSPPWTYVLFTNHGPNGSFAVNIPQQFTAQAPPTDHDGRTWIHGSATITAFSEINAAQAKLAYPLSPKTTDITYEAKGPHWRVASGVEGSSIVYAKVYFLGPDIFWLKLTYPKADQDQYGPMVARVANSFVPSVKP